jgi:hypothetical protein
MKHNSEINRRSTPPAPTGWHREASCPCLRIEPSGGEAQIFPYNHLVTATLVHADGADTLRLKFSSDDVEIIGHNLRDLLVAIQEFSVKWLRPVPERYSAIARAESGTISSIRITAPPRSE